VIRSHSDKYHKDAGDAPYWSVTRCASRCWRSSHLTKSSDRRTPAAGSKPQQTVPSPMPVVHIKTLPYPLPEAVQRACPCSTLIASPQAPSLDSSPLLQPTLLPTWFAHAAAQHSPGRTCSHSTPLTNTSSFWQETDSAVSCLLLQTL